MGRESHHPLLSKAPTPTPTPPLLLISLRKHKSTSSYFICASPVNWNPTWLFEFPARFSRKLPSARRQSNHFGQRCILTSAGICQEMSFPWQRTITVLHYVRMCFDFWYLMFWVDLADFISTPWAFPSLTNKSRVPMYFDKYILPRHKRHHYINYMK